MIESIICLCYNTCIDRVLSVIDESPNVFKVKQKSETAAGKGVNVAYILSHYLKIPCMVVGYTGKDYWPLFKERLIKTNNCIFVTNNKTRVNITLLNEKLKSETHIHEIGSSIEEDVFIRIRNETLSKIKSKSWIIMCGSVPQGISPCLFGSIIKDFNSKDCHVIVDTSAEYLQAALENGASLIKPNRDELRSLVGKECIHSSSDLVHVIGSLHSKYPQTDIFLSDGANGSYFVSGTEMRHVIYDDSTPLTVVSTVGAGDSLLAGYIYGLYSGFNLNDRLRFAVRVASSHISTPTVGKLDHDILTRKEFKVRIETIDMKERN